MDADDTGVPCDDGGGTLGTTPRMHGEGPRWGPVLTVLLEPLRGGPLDTPMGPTTPPCRCSLSEPELPIPRDRRPKVSPCSLCLSHKLESPLEPD